MLAAGATIKATKKDVRDICNLHCGNKSVFLFITQENYLLLVGVVFSWFADADSDNFLRVGASIMGPS